MKNTALITGASSGIGLELARVHASKGGDLVLVARSKDRLDEIKNELESAHKISVCNIRKDLSLPHSAQEVYDEISRREISIECLINNAGFGDYGFFADGDSERILQMISLNITALTHLTRLYLRDMIERGEGKIMNVASLAAFQPGPLMAVYYASKAYVLSLSEAIANEARDRGVTITALCPGPTASGFWDVNSLEKNKMIKGKKLPTSKEVAAYGYAAMMKGKDVAIHGFANRFIVFIERFFPKHLIVKIVRKIQEVD
ncbi:MAG: SDR family oxidoreductase [Helicobacteraceae bacterium]|jgi:short-subunit dehydrogenase|nr:SDR family oxidoreductase [Helicobacteraceae bacterium]